MIFYYKAKRGPKEAVEGKIEAVSPEAAVAKLRQMGMVPVLVKKQSQSSIKKGLSGKKKAAFSGGKVSKKHPRSRCLKAFISLKNRQRTDSLKK